MRGNTKRRGALVDHGRQQLCKVAEWVGQNTKNLADQKNCWMQLASKCRARKHQKLGCDGRKWASPGAHSRAECQSGRPKHQASGGPGKRLRTAGNKLKDANTMNLGVMRRMTMGKEKKTS